MGDLPLFDLPSDLDPGPGPGEHESPAARLSRLNRNLLARGTHPATRLPLLDSGLGLTCGTCAHAGQEQHGSRRYWKCDIGRLGTSHSASSDIRKKWPACQRYVDLADYLITVSGTSAP